MYHTRPSSRRLEASKKSVRKRWDEFLARERYMSSAVSLSSAKPDDRRGSRLAALDCACLGHGLGAAVRGCTALLDGGGRLSVGSRLGRRLARDSHAVLDARRDALRGRGAATAHAAKSARARARADGRELRLRLRRLGLG